MNSIDKTVLKETKYISYVVIVLSILMNIVFVVYNKWNYTVLLGNIVSAIVGVLNFLFMGITIQKALTKDESDAKKIIKLSQSARNFAMFIIIGACVLLSWFNTISLLVPMFFPRLAIMIRPLWKDKENEQEGMKE